MKLLILELDMKMLSHTRKTELHGSKGTESSSCCLQNILIPVFLRVVLERLTFAVTCSTYPG
jgi:hypothetical protein